MLDQGESNGQIFWDIIESNQGKDNSEHLLGINVRSQANKDRSVCVGKSVTHSGYAYVTQ